MTGEAMHLNKNKSTTQPPHGVL